VPPGTRRALGARWRELDPARRQPARFAVRRVEPQADALPRDFERLNLSVRLKRVAQLVVTHARDDEVFVLVRAAEQLVAHAAADEIRVEPERTDVLGDVPPHRAPARQMCATTAISTFAPIGSPAIWIVARAGGLSPTYRP
jgi:hypothetical protein